MLAEVGEGSADAAALARALRDAGVEVVLVSAGPGAADARLDPALLAEVGVQEDADAVGVVGPASAEGAVLAPLVGALEAAGRADAVAFSLGSRPVGEVAAWVAASVAAEGSDAPVPADDPAEPEQR